MIPIPTTAKHLSSCVISTKCVVSLTQNKLKLQFNFTVSFAILI